MARSLETKTLQQLEGSDWGEPEYPSHVTRTCHAVRRKRICDLTPEELRIAIGQKMGLKFLLPVAVKLLAADPLVSGDFHPGDLLMKVLKAPPGAWQESPSLKASHADVLALAPTLAAAIEQMDDFWKDTYQTEIQKAFDHFRSCSS